MAGWYDEAWSRRIPASFIVSAASGSPVDMTVTLPTDWDDFWDNVDSAGADVRICAPDGVTLLDYKLLTWVFASRTATIEISGVTVAKYTGSGSAADGTVFLMLYWGNSGATDAQAVFTASSPAPGAVYLGTGIAEGWEHQRPAPGSTSPVDELTKGTGETVRYWVTIPEPDRRATPHNGSTGHWGVSYSRDDVLLAGVSQSSMFSLVTNAVALVEGDGGVVRLGYEVSGGTDGTAYTLSETVTWYMSAGSTKETQIINPRAILRVNDLSEA